MAEYLVTGGCGFVGSHLCDALLSDGHSVTAIDDMSSGKRTSLLPDVCVIEDSICDPEAMKRAAHGKDGIFHLAGIASVESCNREWRRGHLTNQTGSVTVFEAAKHAGGIPVVYASSAAIYGDAGEGSVDEDRPPSPLTSYGVDKLGSELHGRIGWSVHGVPTVGLRPFNIYGPRQDPSSAYSGVISIFNDRLRRQLPVTVYGDGLQSRDFVYVSDVVRFFQGAMQHSSFAHGLVLNICTGRSITLLDLIATLSRLHGIEPDIVHAPPRIGDIRHSVGNPTRAISELGITAAVALEDGLTRLIKADRALV